MPKESARTLFLLLFCLLLPGQASSQEPRQAESSERGSGIVRSVDPVKGSIEIRVKSRTHPNVESVYTLWIGPHTKISKHDGTPVTPSELKEGHVVTWSGIESGAVKSTVRAIVVQNACTPATCARSNCNRACHSDACRCTKT